MNRALSAYVLLIGFALGYFAQAVMAALPLMVRP